LFEKLDWAMHEQAAKPTWITSFNVMCLKTLPHVMEEYGPLRNKSMGGRWAGRRNY
jgi:hypothetical protein